MTVEKMTEDGDQKSEVRGFREYRNKLRAEEIEKRKEGR